MSRLPVVYTAYLPAMGSCPPDVGFFVDPGVQTYHDQSLVPKDGFSGVRLMFGQDQHVMWLASREDAGSLHDLDTCLQKLVLDHICTKAIKRAFGPTWVRAR